MTTYTSTTANKSSDAWETMLPEEIIKRLKTTQEVLTANAVLGVHSPYFMPIPDFVPMPMMKERNPYLFESILYAPMITDPRKFACIVDASMIPDARPPQYSLRQYLRLFGYLVYAMTKRVRRENKR